VLTCYLDDSGKDPENIVETVAGYIARDSDWRLFEKDVEQWFDEYGVEVLHAKDLHGTKGEFENWSVLKKQAFVSRICQSRQSYLMMGMSASIQKEPYRQMIEQRGNRKTRTPYSFCFNTIIDWVLRDIRIGAAANSEGVAFVLEAGHENNAEAERLFYEIKENHGLENILKSISFVSKETCRAIQLADFIAFYVRRDANSKVKEKNNDLELYQTEFMLKIIMESLQHRGYIATEFDPQVGPRR
jgi:hypothetical protein